MAKHNKNTNTNLNIWRRFSLIGALPVLLSYAWSTFAVLTVSLALIWLGSRLPSDRHSADVLVQQQHYVCTADEDGTIRLCSVRVSQPVPHWMPHSPSGNTPNSTPPSSDVSAPE